MAILPVRYDTTTQTVHIIHENHESDIALADINFSKMQDDSLITDTISLVCTSCGGVSSHPVTGGASGPRIQLLFLRMLRLRADDLGLTTAQRTLAARKLRLRNRIEQLGERFRIAAVTSEDDVIDEG